MPANQERTLSTHDFSGVTLTISTNGYKNYFELTGNTQNVSPGDKERIASIVAKALDVDHEAAFLMLWDRE